MHINRRDVYKYKYIKTLPAIIPISFIKCKLTLRWRGGREKEVAKTHGKITNNVCSSNGDGGGGCNSTPSTFLIL